MPTTSGCFDFKNGISQEELAFRCELDRTYISAVERCIWNVALSNIEKIASALHVDPWLADMFYALIGAATAMLPLSRLHEANGRAEEYVAP